MWELIHQGRIYSKRKYKSIVDPFGEEKEESVEIIFHQIQLQIHQNFTG